MKKIQTLVFVFITFFISMPVFADIPRGPGYHYVGGCTRIVNQDAFPEIVLISTSEGAMYDGKKGKILEKGKCLSSYKFSHLSIFWIPKNKLSSIDLENLRTKTEKDLNSGYDDAQGNHVYFDRTWPLDLNLLFKDITFYNGEVPDNNPLVKEDTEYSLAQKKDGSFVLYKSKQVQEFNNGQPPRVETFNPPQDTNFDKNNQNTDNQSNKNIEKKLPVHDQSQLQPQIPQSKNRGFWHRFACILGIIRNC